MTFLHIFDFYRYFVFNRSLEDERRGLYVSLSGEVVLIDKDVFWDNKLLSILQDDGTKSKFYIYFLVVEL